MSLKDDWKDTGKNIGHTAVGLGRAILRSAKVGAEKVLDETPKDTRGNDMPTGLRDEWSRVGRSFGMTGCSLGRAAAGTARKIADSIDNDPESGNGGNNM